MVNSSDDFREEEFVQADIAREKFARTAETTLLGFGLAAATMGLLFCGSTAYLLAKHSNPNHITKNTTKHTKLPSNSYVQPDSIKLSLPKP